VCDFLLLLFSHIFIMKNNRLCILIIAIILGLLSYSVNARLVEANVSMSNVTIARWILSFGFSAAGTISFNATPDQDIEDYYSNFSILICNETESKAIHSASAVDLCYVTCASRYYYNPMPSNINISWNSTERGYYNMFLLNLNCSYLESGSEDEFGDLPSDELRMKWYLNYTIEALNPDTDYPQLSLEDVGNPPIVLSLTIIATIAFIVCVLQGLIRSYIFYMHNSRWREVLYEEKRFHYGVSFIVILFLISLEGVCLYSYWMEYANRGGANLFSAYFGYLFAAIAHAGSLAVIEMWVFGRTKPPRGSASISSSVEKAMSSKLNTVSVWCFLLVACLFYSFYVSTSRAWASMIMATALLLWSIKPVLRIIQQVYELTEAARPGSSHEQKQLLVEDENDEQHEADEVPKANDKEKSLWKQRVMPYFASVWPIIFIIFALAEIFWILLPACLPWYLSYLQFQPFLPIILAAVSSIFVFESNVNRPGPPKDHPSPM